MSKTIMPRVSDIKKIMDELYPPTLSESWDRVGLMVGDDHEVGRIGFAVDPCKATIDEAIALSAQMLITHHPLFLRGTHAVTFENSKGKWAINAIKNNCALMSAHTNADVMLSTRALADLIPATIVAPLDSESGIGGICELEKPMRLGDCIERLKSGIPHIPAGVRVAGNMDARVSRVAICSGAGDSLLPLVKKAHVDAYITADLRHHPASDFLWDGGCALVDLTHFASEWPLMARMRQEVRAACEENGWKVDTYISDISTDVWNATLV